MCSDGNTSIFSASEDRNDALAGWRCRACVRDVGGERQEEERQGNNRIGE